MEVLLKEACHLLMQGDVVALPTETVYGLAACIDQPAAIKKIFDLKKRPLKNPLIVHLSSFSQLLTYVSEIPPGTSLLADAFWPGPLTLVLATSSSKIPDLIRACLPTVAFRIPSHALVREVIKEIGPLVMPSANLSGSPSATLPEHVERDFGCAFPILKGGASLHGLESTILAFEECSWKIARLGAIAQEAFIPILGYKPLLHSILEKPICPGQLFKHYAPKARLHLMSSIPEFYQGVVLGFSERIYPAKSTLVAMGSENSPEEVAHNLYSLLRHLDSIKCPEALVDCAFPQEGLWATIHERLKRAADAG